MKNYEEMAKYVLETRDKYIKKKKRQQALMKKYTSAILCSCFAIVIGFSVWNYVNNPSTMPIKTVTTETTTAKQTEITTYTEKSDITITTTETQIDPIRTEQEDESQVTAVTPNSSESITSAALVTSVESYTEPSTESLVESITVSNTNSPTSDYNTDQSIDEITSISQSTLHWDEMSISQQYSMAEFGSPIAFYKTAEKKVLTDKIGDYIDIAYMSGYDVSTDTYYHCYAGAYLINGYTDKEIIAIQFEDNNEYFVYYNLSANDINKQALDSILANF